MRKVAPTPVKMTTNAIIGHEAVLSYLAHAAEGDRLAHAYLFVGPEHGGKMTVAREFARMLFPGIAEISTHPDFVIIERERDAKTGKLHGSIVLDQIHALTGRLSLGAFIGGYKVCVIDGAELLTIEAANALLKTLEEPRPKTVLILLASSETDVLPTIRSRCQVTRFGRTSAVRIIEALAERGVPQEKAALYAGLSGGLPGKALAFAEDPSALDEMFALRDTLLSFPSLAVAERWSAIDKLLPAKMPFQEAGDRAVQVLDLAAELTRDAILAASDVEGSAIHVDVADRIAAWAADAGASRLAQTADRITEARTLIDGNVNPRTALERLALSF